jgi:hypothetical protein
MWQWLKRLVVRLLSLDKFDALQLPPATENNGIEVKLISHDIRSFQRSITKVHEEVGFTEAELNRSIEDLLTNELPKAYKDCFKRNREHIFICGYPSFKGNDKLLAKAYPIIKERLKALGITKVGRYNTSTINNFYIETNDITKASEAWDKQTSTSLLDDIKIIYPIIKNNNS